MSTVKSVIQRLRFPLEVMVVCVRWYVAYQLSLRRLEEMMEERGVSVDHSTSHRWIIKLVPVVEKTFRRRKVAVRMSWRMDETYIKAGGHWTDPYRAVDKAGHIVDFVRSAKRNRAAVQPLLTRAIGNNGLPEGVTIDTSGANTADTNGYNAEHDTTIAIWHCKYLNNIVEQDHRAVKSIVRPMLGFKLFHCARVIIAGIEIAHMLRKGQMRSNDKRAFSAA
ncbi:MAG: IS6 family transposase [Vulcanimicrobiaceae bacterium]